MEQQETLMERRDAVDAKAEVEVEAKVELEAELEFIGALEDVTRGWTGPTDDFWDGDWSS